MKRREVLKVLGAAGAVAATGASGACDPDRGSESSAPPAEPQGPAGTPSDPDLLRPRIWWQKQLTPAELATLAALCDTIIPADEKSPSASAVGVPDYIDEWASAPYDWAREGLAKIRKGFAWLDAEATRRFGKAFAELSADQRDRIAADICYLQGATQANQEAAVFFDQVRDLTATGFYTTREGMQDLGYVGNVALPRFEPPPPEVLRHLGLEPEDR